MLGLHPEESSLVRSSLLSFSVWSYRPSRKLHLAACIGAEHNPALMHPLPAHSLQAAAAILLGWGGLRGCMLCLTSQPYRCSSPSFPANSSQSATARRRKCSLLLLPPAAAASCYMTAREVRLPDCAQKALLLLLLLFFTFLTPELLPSPSSPARNNVPPSELLLLSSSLPSSVASSSRPSPSPYLWI